MRCYKLIKSVFNVKFHCHCGYKFICKICKTKLFGKITPSMQVNRKPQILNGYNDSRDFGAWKKFVKFLSRWPQR